MDATQKVCEEYKQAARQFIRQLNIKERDTSIEYEGRMSGLEIALRCLGVGSDELLEIYKTCREEVQNELEQEELDATERPVAQARVEGGTTAEYRRLAYQYEEQAKWGKALEYYNKAIEAYPKVTGPLAKSDLHALKEKSKGIANFIKAERGVRQ